MHFENKDNFEMNSSQSIKNKKCVCIGNRQDKLFSNVIRQHILFNTNTMANFAIVLVFNKQNVLPNDNAKSK